MGIISKVFGRKSEKKAKKAAKQTKAKVAKAATTTKKKATKVAKTTKAKAKTVAKTTKKGVAKAAQKTAAATNKVRHEVAQIIEPAPKKKSRKKTVTRPAGKDAQPQCKALTGGGGQCKNSARAGSKYCGSHKGYQPPARSKTGGSNTKPRASRAKDTAAAARRKPGTKRCAAKTKSGKQCQRTAIARGKYCSLHKTS